MQSTKSYTVSGFGRDKQQLILCLLFRDGIQDGLIKTVKEPTFVFLQPT